MCLPRNRQPHPPQLLPMLPLPLLRSRQHYSPPPIRAQIPRTAVIWAREAFATRVVIITSAIVKTDTCVLRVVHGLMSDTPALRLRCRLQHLLLLLLQPLLLLLLQPPLQYLPHPQHHPQPSTPLPSPALTTSIPALPVKVASATRWAKLRKITFVTA